jgi:hypothetical protein
MSITTMTVMATTMTTVNDNDGDAKVEYIWSCCDATTMDPGCEDAHDDEHWSFQMQNERRRNEILHPETIEEESSDDYSEDSEDWCDRHLSLWIR